MINVTEYLKGRSIYSNGLIQNFKRMQRVQPYMNSAHIRTVSGRYHGGTYMSEQLFKLFEAWLKHEPLPLLSRQEYEVAEFMMSFYSDAIYQYRVGKYIFDFYLPGHNLLVEYDESHHNVKSRLKSDRQKEEEAVRSGYSVARIKSKSVFKDLAIIAQRYP